MPVSNTEADAILNRMRGVAAPAFDAQIALFDGDPLGAGTELSGNGYARYDPADGDWTAPAAATPDGRMVENQDEWLFGEATAAWAAASHFAIVDAAGTVRYSDTITGGPVTVASGNRARIPAGSIRVRIGNA